MEWLFKKIETWANQRAGELKKLDKELTRVKDAKIRIRSVLGGLKVTIMEEMPTDEEYEVQRDIDTHEVIYNALNYYEDFLTASIVHLSK